TGTVIISPLSVAGTASGDTTVCQTANSVTVRLTGNTGTIQWQSATLNGTFANIAGATGATYTSATRLTADTRFRAVVTSGACSADTSNIVTATVSPSAVGGSITGDDTVCTGTNSTVLTLNGYTGTIAKWQSSASSSFTTVTDIPNTAGQTSYTAQDLSATTYYRAVITNGVCTIFSSTGTVTVDQLSLGGTVSGSKSVCTGGNTSTLTLSNYRGTIQWQSSIDSITFFDISGSTATTITATNLNTTTFYRAIVTNGTCPSVSSTNAGKISVDPASVGGRVSGSTTVCATGNSTVLTLSGNVGTISWQSATMTGTFGTISGQTASTYTASGLTVSTRYRAVVKSGTCTSVLSDTATILVDSASVGGTVSGSKTVCTGTNSTTLNLNGYRGTIRWQSSTDNSVYSYIDGATSTSYTATDLTQTTYYRAVVKNGVCDSAIST
ncbi:MAG: hypothetical protein ACKO6K_06135, partial [Chitinophagaceae bacterium]